MVGGVKSEVQPRLVPLEIRSSSISPFKYHPLESSIFPTTNEFVFVKSTEAVALFFSIPSTNNLILSEESLEIAI